MTSPLPSGLRVLIEAGFEAGRACHGNLELAFQTFADYLVMILEKRHQTLAGDAVEKFFTQLYTDDLYLAVACAQGSNDAWRIFNRHYATLIFNTAYFLCSHRGVAEEIAQSAMGHLFLSDESGLPRIRSYDGRGLLSSWVRAVIAHQVHNELLLKHRHFISLDEVIQLPDPGSLQELDLQVRANRYGQMIREILSPLGADLSAQERWFLILYYVEGCPEKELAGLLNLSRAKVNYQLGQGRKKLAKEITAKLQIVYHLDEAALHECIAELCENPTYSLRLLSEASLND